MRGSDPVNVDIAAASGILVRIGSATFARGAAAGELGQMFSRNFRVRKRW
jgi:hypothetical protein